jgi:hypothetical protein
MRLGLFEVVLQHIAQGKSQTEACQLAGVSRDTFWKYLRRHPELRPQVDTAIIAGRVRGREAKATQRKFALYESQLERQLTRPNGKLRRPRPIAQASRVVWYLCYRVDITRLDPPGHQGRLREIRSRLGPLDSTGRSLQIDAEGITAARQLACNAPFWGTRVTRKEPFRVSQSSQINQISGPASHPTNHSYSARHPTNHPANHSARPRAIFLGISPMITGPLTTLRCIADAERESAQPRIRRSLQCSYAQAP